MMAEIPVEQASGAADTREDMWIGSPCSGGITPLLGLADGCEVEVRWLMSGEIAAVVCCHPNMGLMELKAELFGLIGVPISDQRIFLDDDEVFDAAISVGDLGPTLKLLQCTIDPRETNLKSFHVPLTFDPLPPGRFMWVKNLATSSHARISLHRWSHEQGSEEEVVVKKLRDRTLERVQSNTEYCDMSAHLQRRKDTRDVEDPLTEIGVLKYLAEQPDLPPYLMKCKAVFAEDQHTWLVTEYAEGGELFSIAASAEPPQESEVKHYMWQVLHAVEYLHRHNIGHRDVSLENVLIKSGAACLMDFGMAVQSRSVSGKPLRYFRPVGKDYYRAPECYVPCQSESRVTPRPGDKGGDVVFLRTAGSYFCEMRLPPDATPHRSCLAQVWGYAAEPADIWSVGICLYILTFQIAPWDQAVSSDRNFAYSLRQQDQPSKGKFRQQNKPLPSAEAMQAICGMLRPDPSQRPSIHQCLSMPWFADLFCNPVPRHTV